MTRIRVLTARPKNNTRAISYMCCPDTRSIRYMCCPDTLSSFFSVFCDCSYGCIVESMNHAHTYYYYKSTLLDLPFTAIHRSSSS